MGGDGVIERYPYRRGCREHVGPVYYVRPCRRCHLEKTDTESAGALILDLERWIPLAHAVPGAISGILSGSYLLTCPLPAPQPRGTWPWAQALLPFTLFLSRSSGVTGVEQLQVVDQKWWRWVDGQECMPDIAWKVPGWKYTKVREPTVTKSQVSGAGCGWLPGPDAADRG